MIIRNLGPISEVNISIRPYTVFFGDNGSGKTLTEYVIYGFMKYVRDVRAESIFEIADVESLLRDKRSSFKTSEIISKLTDKIVTSFNKLGKNFYDELFADKEIYVAGKTQIIVDENDVKSLVIYKNNSSWYMEYRLANNDALVRFSSKESDQNNELLLTMNVIKEMAASDITSFGNDIADNLKKEVGVEKIANSLTILAQRLLFYRNNINFIPAERIGINMFRKDLINRRAEISFEDQANNNNSLYPKPISDYLLYLNKTLSNLNKHENGSKFVSEYKKELIPGDFNYDSELDSIVFSTQDTKKIDFKLLSSSLKSLLGIDIVLLNVREGVDDINDVVFIDEPEMNLHPRRQRLIADLLYDLSQKTEMTIILSTHSDYFIKETINKLLAEKRAGKYDKSQFGVYEFTNNTVKHFDDITSEENTEIANFDDTTKEILKTYYDLIED